MEEFIEGHEGFYDTISIGGRVVHEFITHYYPQRLGGDAHPLDLAAVRSPPIASTPRDIPS